MDSDYRRVKKNLTEVAQAAVSEEIEKANEGDTKMIFGTPFVFSGGEWIKQDKSGQNNGSTVVTPMEMNEGQIKDAVISSPNFKAYVESDVLGRPVESQQELENLATGFAQSSMKDPKREKLHDILQAPNKACVSEPVKKAACKNEYRRVQKNLAGVHDPSVIYGATTTTDEHSHSYRIDRDGNGQTNGMIGGSSVVHTHEIVKFQVREVNSHIHYLDQKDKEE